MTVHDDNEYIPSRGTHRCEGLVCHGSSCMTRRRVFVYLGSILDSVGSDDVDEVAVNGGGMDASVEGSRFTQHFSFCEASCVCVKNVDSMFL